MQVQGVDPLILGQVQERDRKLAVKEAERFPIIDGQPERDHQPSPDLERVANKLNKTSEAFDIGIRFQIDRESGEVFVLVIDKNEGKIIRRIPPENMVRMATQLQYAIGLLVNELV